MPPLGPLYGQMVFADVSLAAEPAIVFSAGTCIDAIAMRWADFARTVKPIVGKFAGRSTDRAPEYHLSWRE
jgi:prolyl-tRNA editing enzyme YbaK/EbsC (Cys-tRNA(Pro) deacylase)